MLQWLTGSLNRADWPTIRLADRCCCSSCCPCSSGWAGAARAAELGEDTAAGLGITAAAHRRAAAARRRCWSRSASPLRARSPSSSFLAGPIARALNGGRTTLVGAALVGAVIVVGGDYVAAYLVPDVNYPVGVVTGAFGAPFLLWLLATGRTSRRS